MIVKNVETEESKPNPTGPNPIGIGLIAGIVIAVLTFGCMISDFGLDIFSAMGSGNDAIYAAIIIGPFLAISAGVVGFIVVVWGVRISEANAQAAAIEAGMEDIQSADENLEAETTTEANPIEMGTCIYCGKEIDEETAICDDCLKGQQSNFA